MTKAKLSALVVLTCTMGLILAACSSNNTDTAENTSTQSTNAAPAETEAEKATSAELPSDFPKEVPLINGTITNASSLDGTSKQWLVEMAVNDVEHAFAEGVDLLKSGGFTEVFKIEDPEAPTSQWNNENFSVTFEASTSDGVPGASYVFTAK